MQWWWWVERIFSIVFYVFQDFCNEIFHLLFPDNDAITDLLIRRGAEINPRNNTLLTPLLRAVDCSKLPENNTETYNISFNLWKSSKYYQNFRYFLINYIHHFPVNYRNVNLLIRRGADITVQIPRNSGFTVLHQAASRGQFIDSTINWQKKYKKWLMKYFTRVCENGWMVCPESNNRY